MSQIKPIADTLQIRIEEDGTITTVTGKMSAEVHQTAEEFLNEVHRLAGGERTHEHLAHQHQTVHVHNHNHEQQRIRS